MTRQQQRQASIDLNNSLSGYTTIEVEFNEFLGDGYYIDADFADPVYETHSLDEYLTICATVQSIAWF